MSGRTASPSGSVVDRALAAIERIANRLPEPFFLFGALYLVVAGVSTVLAAAGVEVRAFGETKPLRGLFSGPGVEFLLTKLGANFIGFPPMETVLTIMLGVGLAERSGLLTALVRWGFRGAPRWAVPYAVSFVGISASLMADAAFIIVPPLAMMVFKAAGRHPVAGLLGGFAAVGAGIALAPVVMTIDVLYAGITNQVSESMSIGGSVVTPVSNYYFSLASSLVLTVVAGMLIDRLIEPRVVRAGVPRDETAATADPTLDDVGLGKPERRGLTRAAASFALVGVLMISLALWPNSPLRNAEGGFLPESPLLDSVTTLLFLTFAVPGIVYGAVVGTIARAADVPKMMAASLRELSGFLITAFMLGQLIALFNWTNLGGWIAVSGADAMRAFSFDGYLALFGFVVLVSLLNLVIVSGPGLWSITAAVFVPMFTLIGLEPGLAQAAFRVGDSATQIITPMNPYMIVVLAQLRRYEPQAGMGTLLARMLPFVVPFWGVWMLVLAVFYFADLPLGPGMEVHIGR
ncbi:AbgT family transporter [Saccharopolyspora sp. SCSIO 74807]|uniref:AbgT family transporter n=1 Tax=Saccharopolyspora sp. SCSIO 74807 TaxID=3118084 RepID=UPI0030CD5049